MQRMTLAKVLRRTGAALHAVSLLTWLSALYAIYQILWWAGRPKIYAPHYTTATIVYRFGLGLVMLIIALWVGRLAEDIEYYERHGAAILEARQEAEVTDLVIGTGRLLAQANLAR